MMHITLKNLGRLQEATIDINKDLIVLVGPNNTSKTYVAHALYGLYKGFGQNYVDAVRRCVSRGVDDRGRATLPSQISLEMFEREHLGRITSEIGISYQKQLADVFAARDDAFAGSSVELALSESLLTAMRKRTIEQDVERTINLSDGVVSVRKRKGSDVWEFEQLSGTPTPGIATDESTKGQMSSLEIAYIHVAMDFLSSGQLGFSMPFILTAERAAIQLFSKELLVGRALLVESMLGVMERHHGPSLEYALAETLRSSARRYPLAIRDGLFFSEDIARLEKHSSEYAPFADRLEREMSGGSFRVASAGEMLFRPNSVESEIGLPLASSSVKSLAGLSFYLRHIAKRGNFLIVDEPELNLHPDNQRRVARLLVRLSQSGLRVLISTHSDYVVREINNSIMLSSDRAATLRRRLEYGDDEVVAPGKVAAYLFDRQRARSIEIPATGMEVETIDEEINSLNALSQEIYFSLFGGAGA
jgi:hypothetical protein